MKDVFKRCKDINELIICTNLCKKGKFINARQRIEKLIKNNDNIEFILNILYSINSNLNYIKKAHKNCSDLVKNSQSSYNYNLLGNLYKFKKNYSKAIKCYKEAIKKKESINKIYFDFKNFQNLLKNLIKMKKFYFKEKLILGILTFKLKLNLNQLVNFSRPHFANNYTNTENFIIKLEEFIKKINSKKNRNKTFLKKIEKFVKINIQNFKLNADYDNPYYNLALVNDKLKKYKKAIKYFNKSNLIEKNNRYNKNILEVLYKYKDKKKFITQIKKFKNKNINKRDFTAYAISNFVSHQWNIKNYYKFCDKPMDFIYNENLIDKKIVSKKFINNLKKIIINFSNHTKTPVVKGFKSLGNLFEIKNKNIELFRKILINRLHNYKKKFSYSDSDMIKSWPKKFKINAWYIRLRKGGEVTSHIHHGWVSGVFYIKKPIQNKKDLEISYKYQNLPETTKKSPKVNLKTNEGRLILFPSSLPHRVLPYKSKKTERVSIAFDMIPN